MQDVISSPFSPVTSKGLGISTSSLNKIGHIVPSHSVGQANVSLFSNLSNGNLVVQDRKIVIDEVNLPIELSFTYNSAISDPKKAWQFSHKKIIQLPDAKQKTIIFQETDGHLTTYVLDAKKQDSYVASEITQEGLALLSFDKNAQCWIRVSPVNKTKEYFSTQGLLIKKEDATGLATTYEYNQNQELIAIVSGTGNRYELTRKDNCVEIVSVKEKQLIQRYQFDNLGRLSISETADGYQTHYTYDEKKPALLTTVSQDDQTKIILNYTDKDAIQTAYVGENKYQFEYANQQRVGTLIDGMGNKTIINFDQDGDVLESSRECGYSSATGIETTKYNYNAKKQPEKIIYPHGGSEIKVYDEITGLIKQEVKPDRQKTEYLYQGNNIICQVEYPNETTPSVTRYIYDMNYDGKAHQFLRFKISPEGKVTEYRPNVMGLIASERVYLDAGFDISSYTKDKNPTLDQLQKWSNTQNQQHIHLIDYDYNSRAQIINKIEYQTIDEKGSGINDEFSSVEKYEFDLYKNLIKQSVKKSDKLEAITKQQFDGLQRLVKKTDAVGNETKYEYRDKESSINIEFENGKKEFKKYGSNGLITELQESVRLADHELQVRITKFNRDKAGRLSLTTMPDGRSVYTFFDRQNRNGFEISALGVVTEYRYDVKNRYREKIRYANAIDINEFKKTCSVDSLISLLEKVKDKNNDRVSYEFENASGQIVLTVDENKAVTKKKYNKANKPTKTIHYSEAISEDEISILKDFQVFKRKVDESKDRVTKVEYNKDNQIISETDAAGYITEYKRDIAGRVSVKIVDGKLHTYYFYNNQNEVVAIIDPEKYFTKIEYYPNGLLKSEKRYAAKTEKIVNEPPKESEYDQVKSYEYDELDRLIKTYLPNEILHSLKHDAAGNIISDQIQDLKVLNHVNQFEGDYARGEQCQYDGWKQIVKTTNPIVNRLLLESSEKNQQEQIWETSSTKNKYDQNGLKISSTDGLNHTTLYYYDDDNRQTISVSPMGRVTETIYNSFNEIIELKRYSELLPVDSLLGGKINEKVSLLLVHLKKTASVSSIKMTRNQSGQVSELIDPSGNTKLFSYNMFNEIEEEKFPINDSKQILSLKHEYDTRGLETKTTKKSNNKEIISKRTYENALGKETSFTNENGHVFKKEYDMLGNVTKLIDPMGDIESKMYDAFNRVVTEIDALNNRTVFTFDQSGRECKVDLPNMNTGLTTTENIFKEKIAEKDRYNFNQKWVHNSDGKISSYINQKSETDTYLYDINEKLTYSKMNDSKGIESKLTYDADGYLATMNEVSSQGELKTSYERDGFGNIALETKPNKSVIKNEFDLSQQLVSCTIDQGGLNINKNLQYNFNNQLILSTTKNGNNTKVYTEKNIIDEFGRSTGSVIDPLGLNLQKNNILDDLGNVVCKVDENLNKSYQFFDAKNQLRFKIDAEGAVIEYVYGKIKDQVLQKRHYSIKLDNLSAINEKMSCVELQAKIKPSESDAIKYYQYDGNGNKLFTVNSLGVVKGSKYNLNNKVIEKITYDEFVDISKIVNGNIANLITSPNQSRSIRYIRNEKNEICFTIDPSGYVIEEKRDDSGNVIAKIAYATQLSDPQKFSLLDVESAKLRIITDPINDRITYQFFDDRNHPSFIVDPEGFVIEFIHNEMDLVIQTCAYKNSLPKNVSYDEARELLKNYKPDANRDKITKCQYDAVNRKVADIDPYNYIDRYSYDVMGNIVLHTDRKNNQWSYEYDAANRKIKESTPVVNVTSVTKQINQDKHDKITLIENESKISIEKVLEYDAKNNPIVVIEAANAKEKRVVKLEYDKCDRYIGKKLIDVLVDDPSKSADFVNRPEKLVNITERVVLNAHGLKIVELNAEGLAHFYIRDSEGHVRYEVAEDGTVKSTIYNAHGESISEIAFHLPINLDCSQYLSTGIPLSVIENNGVLVKHEKDRETQFTRDKRGNIEKVTKPVAFHYQLNQKDKQIQSGYHSPQEKYRYNAFNQVIQQSRLVDVDDKNQETWAHEFSWYNKNGMTVAHCDEADFVTVYDYDAYQNTTLRWEWEKTCLESPSVNTSFEKLLTLHQSSVKDRWYSFEYNLLNNPITEKRGEGIDYENMGATIQEMDLENGKPIKKDIFIKGGLTKKYTYNPTGKRITTEYEDGSKDFSYYDEQDKLIAFVDVARDSEDENGNLIKVVPLTFYGNDAQGNQVKLYRSATGCDEKIDSNIVPQPKSVNLTDDQVELSLLDNRDLPLYKQDANKNIFSFTHTSSKQVAREWHALDNWDIKFPTVKTLTYLDEKRYNYDEKNRPVFTVILRDGRLIQSHAVAYNSFGDVIKEGANSNNWQLFNEYDNLGRCWLSNHEKGGYKITLYNLRDYETGFVQSPTIDLAKQEYQNITQLLTTNTNDIQISKQRVNQIGQVIDKISDGLYPVLPSRSYTGLKTDKPINFIVGSDHPEFGSVSLSWDIPTVTDNRDESPAFISLIQDTTFQNEILFDNKKIKTINGRCGIDLSDLSCDTYFATLWTMSLPKSSHGLPNIKDMKVYKTAVKFQLNSNNVKQSKRFVSIECENGIVVLKGNLDKINNIDIYQKENFLSSLPILTNEKNEKYINVSQLTQGSYQLIASNAVGLDSLIKLDFTVPTKSTSSVTYASGDYTDLFYQPSINHYDYDRWNNVIVETDTYNRSSEAEYNINNKLTRRTEPMVEAFDESGISENIRPVTTFAYNSRSFEVGITDANNHTEMYVVDPSGKSLKLIQADGTIAYQQIFDALSRVIRHKDGRGKVWKKIYDCNNNIVQQITPSGILTTYQVDQKNHRIRVDIPGEKSPATYYYNFDALDNIYQSYLPLGQKNEYEYDQNHLPTSMTDPDNNKQEWIRDYFGNRIKEKLFSGATIDFGYDLKKQLILEKGNNQNAYSVSIAENSSNFDIQKFTLALKPHSSRDTQYHYTADLLTKVDDNARDFHTSFSYNASFERVSVDVIGPPVRTLTMIGASDANYYYIQASFFDALGREISTYSGADLASGRFDIGYDRVGNRRFIATYPDMQADKKVSQWFKYNEADYVIINQGILQNNQIQITADQGMELGYSQGYRTSQTIMNGSGKQTQLLSYNDDGLLTNMKNSDDWQVVREYHPSGWTKHVKQFKPIDQFELCLFTDNIKIEKRKLYFKKRTDYSGGIEHRKYILEFTYLDSNNIIKKGEIREQQLPQARFDDSPLTNEFLQKYKTYILYETERRDITPRIEPSTEQFIELDDNGWQHLDQQNFSDRPQITTRFDNLTGQGLPRKQTTDYNNVYDSRANFTDRLDLYYENTNRQSLISGTRTNYLGTSTPAVTKILWDVNGSITSVMQDYQYGALVGIYSTGSDGALFSKRILSHYGAINTIDFSQPVMYATSGLYETNATYYFHDSRGRTIASATTQSSGVRLTNYIQPVTVSFAPPPEVPKPIPMKTTVSFSPFKCEIITTIEQEQRIPVNTHVGINAPEQSTTFPPLVSGSHVVSPNESFDSISQSLYGNSNYGGNIALKNGNTVHDSLSPGSILQLPQVIPVYNNFDTSAPFDKFILAMLGSLYPILQAKEPPPLAPIIIVKMKPHKRSGGLFGGGLMMGLVDAIVIGASCFAGFAAGAAVAASMSSMGTVAATTSGVVTAAVVAGMTDAVGQGVAVSIGLKEHFSLPQAVNVGLSTGIAYGFGGPSMSGFGQSSVKDIKIVGNALYKAGRIAVMQQLSGMATGQIKQFNFRNVINAIASQLVNSSLGKYASNNQFIRGVESTAVNTVVGQVINHDKFNLGMAIANGIGNGLANEIGQRITKPLQEYAARERKMYEATKRVPEKTSKRTVNTTTNRMIDKPKNKVSNGSYHQSKNTLFSSTNRSSSKFPYQMENKKPTFLDKAKEVLDEVDFVADKMTGNKEIVKSSKLLFWANTAVSTTLGINNLIDGNAVDASKNLLDISMAVMLAKGPLPLKLIAAAYEIATITHNTDSNNVMINSGTLDDMLERRIHQRQ